MIPLNSLTYSIISTVAIDLMSTTKAHERESALDFSCANVRGGSSGVLIFDRICPRPSGAMDASHAFPTPGERPGSCLPPRAICKPPSPASLPSPR